MKNLFYLFLSIILFSVKVLAQDSPSKFGKVSEEEIKATVCPIDSNAHAYFIFDCGETNFTYPQTTVRENDPASSSGFVMETKRHLRLKIIDASAYNYGNIEVPLYTNGRSEEKVIGIDAFSFNIENGKIVKTKFDKDNLIVEQKSENWKLVKIPIPNVKEGTVIEVRYTVRSEFYFNLKNWQFQYSIPVLYSNYETIIPEYFNYHKSIRGYFPVKTSNKRNRNAITLKYVENSLMHGTTQNRSTESYTVDYMEDNDTYMAENIPAFTEDSYLRTSENYISKVEFELSYIKFPSASIKYYTTSWEDISKNLLLHEYFGVELNRLGFLNDFVDLIPANTDKISLIAMATNHIKSKIKWNEKNSVYVTKSLRSAYNEGIGSSADINLCLVGLLGKLGLESYPVLLSTQKNGFVEVTHPSISGFNYVIALVKLDGKNILIDATDPLLPVNQLPVRCLNDKGLIVKTGNADWVDLMGNVSYKNQISFQGTLDSNLSFKGNYTSKLNNYAAYLERHAIKQYSSIDDYVAEFQKNTSGLTVESTQITGLDTLSSDLTLNYDIELSNAAEVNGNLVFISPLLFETTKQSPFKLEKRTYPVEYNYPSVQFISTQFTVPENMDVESLPQPISFSLPDKSAKFTYNASFVGGKVVVTSYFVRNKIIYLPEEYDALKEFYRLMIAKQNEKVILKMK